MAPLSLNGCETDGWMGLQLESGWAWEGIHHGRPHKAKGQGVVTEGCFSHQSLGYGPYLGPDASFQGLGTLMAKQGLGTSLMISTTSPKAPSDQGERKRRSNQEGV